MSLHFTPIDSSGSISRSDPVVFKTDNYDALVHMALFFDAYICDVLDRP